MNRVQTYILVGAGGTATHLMPALTTYLAAFHGNRNEQYRVAVYDGDAFEQHNLDRQLFSPGMVTMNKATAMELMYGDRYPVIGVPAFLGPENIPSIEAGDIVLIAADNYTVRKRIEEHVATLTEAVVINGGNESIDGSVQLWIRDNGENLTPRLTYLHPEIKVIDGTDRAAMTCQQIAELPGGEQTILANMASAHHMLTALWRFHSGAALVHDAWTELQFDLMAGTVEHINQRLNRGWAA